MTQAVAQNDPNVKIPAAVLRAAAASEAVFNAAYKPEPVSDGVSETEQEAGTPAADAAPAPTAEAQAEKVTSEGNTSKSAPKGEDEQSWEHRYKSMKGRYDRAESQVRQLTEQIASLQNVIATMQTAPPPAQKSDETYAERLLTPEEEQDYGPEFLNVVGKKAKEELLPIVKQYEDKIARLEAQLQNVGGYVQQDARTRMMTQLEQSVPNLAELNTSPDFLAWLKLPDPYSGAIRHTLLKEAFDRNDTSRVLAFFRGFLAEEAATAPAEPETGRREPPAKPSLEQFAAPGRAKTAAAGSAPAEKPIFTRAQIAKFYADSAAGKFRGKEAEKDRLEAQIFEAEREGRIR